MIETKKSLIEIENSSTSFGDAHMKKKRKRDDKEEKSSSKHKRKKSASKKRKARPLLEPIIGEEEIDDLYTYRDDQVLCQHLSEDEAPKDLLFLSSVLVYM